MNKLEGTSMSKYATATFMNSQPGFRQALRDARLSTVIACLKLFPETFAVGTRVSLAPGAIAIETGPAYRRFPDGLIDDWLVKKKSLSL